MAIIIDNTSVAAQGDMLIIPMALWAAHASAGSTVFKTEAEKADTVDGGFIVAHSETGHHHMLYFRPVEKEGEHEVNFVAPALYRPTTGPSEMFAFIKAPEGGEIRHLRPYDTHETLVLPKGFEGVLVRQREFSPQGWRRVED